MKSISLNEQDLDKACTNASIQIQRAVMEYRATQDRSAGFSINIDRQYLPPQFDVMCKGIICRHVRAMLDGILDV